LSLQEALVAVSERAGLTLWIPEDIAGHCCATPWNSKGYREGSAFMANKTVEALWRWTGEGSLPVVIDASSCALGLVEDVVPHLSDENRERHIQLEVLDSIAWAHDHLLPRLSVRRRLGSAAVHPACATRHLGIAGRLESLAGELADEVIVPAAASCCGFAGDRGFLHPELTAAATKDLARELEGRSFDAYLCSNRTCEVGLQQATGAPYASFVYVLEELTRA
jgi:D-lactate dehydrogenase